MDEASAWMVQARDGDDEAFDRLMTAFRQPVVGTLYRLVGNAADAEDLAQEVFVKIYRSRQRYKPTARFSTWLFRIVRNTAFNHLRDRKRRPIVAIKDGTEEDNWLADQPDRSASAPDEQLAVDELQAALMQALEALPPNQRTAVVLSRFEEMPYAEIAKVLSTSEAAVKMLMQRARATLAKRLTPFLTEERS